MIVSGRWDTGLIPYGRLPGEDLEHYAQRLAHLDVFATPDTTRARCTSSRVTWGGGECLDDSGELARYCPRHAPAEYAHSHARHRGRRPGERRHCDNQEDHTLTM